MNYKRLFLFVSSVLSSVTYVNAVVAPYYSIRSQGAYESRYQAGLYPFLNRKDAVKPYGVFSVAPDYSRSFNPHAIAHSLFGDDHCSEITISGSRVANRDPDDWLADYFYLPNDFKSTLSFSPIIDTFLVDFSFLIDLSEWANGTYFSIHAPVAHTRFDIRMCEQVQQRGVNVQPEGMFAPGEVNRGQLLEDFTSYAQGDLVQPITQRFPVALAVPTPPARVDKPFLTIFQELKRGLISPCREKETGIADIHIACGWNWIKDWYHVGFSAQAVAPAGNRPQGIVLFEPIIGNGHHWELGVNVNAHCDVWTNTDETQKVALYAQALVTHLFTANQFRTFDLVNSPFSRYMLMQKLDTPVTNNLLGEGVKPTLQFKQEFAPVANISNIRVGVSSALQADIVLTVHMEYNRCSLDVGYNMWARSADKIKAIGPNELDGNRSWALKGDAQVFGFAQADNVDQKFPLVQGQPVALSATQRDATVYRGLNMPSIGAVNEIVYKRARSNPYIDSPRLATAGGNELFGLSTSPDASLGAVDVQAAPDSGNGIGDTGERINGGMVSAMSPLPMGIQPFVGDSGVMLPSFSGDQTFFGDGMMVFNGNEMGINSGPGNSNACITTSSISMPGISMPTPEITQMQVTDSVISVNGNVVINTCTPDTTLVVNEPLEVMLIAPTPLLTQRSGDADEMLPIHTSIPPRVLTLDDLNICSGRTRGMTNGVFAHFHYEGNELRGFTPSIGVGGQAEFATGSGRACKSTVNTALSQWQLWLKICFAFN